MELPFDLAIPLLGLYPKKPETPIQNNLCSPVFIAALLTTARIWRQPKCPSVGEWTEKLWCIYRVEHCSAVKKKEGEEETPTFYNSTDRPGEYLAE